VAVARQQQGRHVSATTNTNTHATIELLDVVFSMRTGSWGFIGSSQTSNTSTVTLRVVGGDEKASLKTETVKYGREIQGTRT
jgi:hypothetical protein